MLENLYSSIIKTCAIFGGKNKQTGGVGSRERKPDKRKGVGEEGRRRGGGGDGGGGPGGGGRSAERLAEKWQLQG